MPLNIKIQIAEMCIQPRHADISGACCRTEVFLAGQDNGQ